MKTVLSRVRNTRTLTAAAAVVVAAGLASPAPAAAAPGEHETVHAHWRENGVKAWNVDVDARITKTSNSKFLAQYYAFDTGGGAYMGLQELGDGSHQAIFSTFRNGWYGSTGMGSSTGNCTTHDESGGGIKCTRAVPWSYNVTYRLRLWRVRTNINTDTWGAWVINPLSGVQWEIGTIDLGRPVLGPSSQVQGTVTFLEDFTNINDCVPPILFAADVSRPRLNNGATTISQESNFISTCARGNAWADANGVTHMSLGSAPVELSIASDGRCLDTFGGLSHNGNHFQLSNCVGVAQQRLTQHVDGTIRHSSGKCLDIRGASTADGAVVQTWDCVGVANQRWTLRSDGTIRGYGGKCMGPNNNGTLIVMWTCNPAVPWHQWRRR